MPLSLARACRAAGPPKELCEKGLKTLVLEHGRNVRHVVDYTTALKDPWQLPHNNRAPRRADKAAQPIQSTLYLYDQSTKQFLVDDTKYSYEQAQPFNWYRGYQVGGRSLLWSRHVFRFSDLDFEANQKEGVGIDWPIRYADISPWYDYVEKFIGASGENPAASAIAETDPAAAVRNDGAGKAHQAGIRKGVHRSKADLQLDRGVVA